VTPSSREKRGKKKVEKYKEERHEWLGKGLLRRGVSVRRAQMYKRETAQLCRLLTRTYYLCTCTSTDTRKKRRGRGKKDRKVK
jgi:uroporphyrinogen-III synthase